MRPKGYFISARPRNLISQMFDKSTSYVCEDICVPRWCIMYSNSSLVANGETRVGRSQFSTIIIFPVLYLVPRQQRVWAETRIASARQPQADIYKLHGLPPQRQRRTADQHLRVHCK